MFYFFVKENSKSYAIFGKEFKEFVNKK